MLNHMKTWNVDHFPLGFKVSTPKTVTMVLVHPQCHPWRQTTVRYINPRSNQWFYMQITTHFIYNCLDTVHINSTCYNVNG